MTDAAFSMTSSATPLSVAPENTIAARGARTGDPGASTVGPHARYALVHVVLGEATKDLIIPQVVEHMMQQARIAGRMHPARVVVLLLEPARVAARRAVRARARELKRNAPGLRVILMPYVSRLGLHKNAAFVGRLLRWNIGRLPVVFHCRGESAAQWAIELKSQFPGAGIVADIRGAGPLELLFDRGLEGPENADDASRREYELALARLRSVVNAAGAVLSVSPDMLAWLRGVGTSEEKLACVPCCVSEVRASPKLRAGTRRALGFDGKLVFTYLGTITPYQHIADGLVPFFRALAAQSAAAHLLCLTSDPVSMRDALAGGGVPADRVTILHVAHSNVAGYLLGADAGLLLRAPSRMNRLSCPTKLGEYLACGLPVILARGMGRTDALLEDAGAGIIVDVFCRDDAALAQEARRVIDVLKDTGETMRNHARELAERVFVWSRYVEVVRKAYARALNA